MQNVTRTFQRAFITAFEYHKPDFVWTNDSVLATTVMQSYVYPFIARTMGLYLVCDFPADASLYNSHAVRQCLLTGKGYPAPEDAIIVIEHENKVATSGKEIEDLVNWNRQLNVLVTYCIGKEVDQLNWLLEAFAPKVAPLGNDANAYLCVLPSENNGIIDKPFSKWWRFFAWNPATRTFEITVTQE